MTQILKSQEIPEVPPENIIDQQHTLIVALKQEILRLQEQLRNTEQCLSEKEKVYQQALIDIDTLTQKIDTLTENNESLIQTLQVFQREFVKRDYKNALTFPIRSEKEINDGPFFMELIRTMKTKISEPPPQQVKVASRSHLGQYYGYFFHSDVEDAEAELFTESTNTSKLKVGKIRSFGKKNYFNQKFRHYFWFNISDNSLKITYKLYEYLLKQLQHNQENQTRKTNIIDMDLRRMDFKLDEDKSEVMKVQAKKLLQIFSLYRPDINYVQGMSYLAWMLLIRMENYQAFVCFSNLVLCDPFVHSLYMFNEQKIRKISSFFQECLGDKRPKLAKHMEKIQVEPDLFLIEWAYTLYSRAFSLRVTSKIWDLWFSEGFNVFFRVAMTIMEMLEPELLDKKENDQIIETIRSSTHRLDEAEFLRILQKQKLYQDLKL